MLKQNNKTGLVLMTITILLVVTLASSLVSAKTCKTGEIKSVLKKALQDYLSNPEESELDSMEIKDLLNFYLAAKDQALVECDIEASLTRKPYRKILNEIKEVVEEEKDLFCTDGTAYEECSTAKPAYCFGGRLVEGCKICGCPEGGECQENEEKEFGTCVFLDCSDGTPNNDCSSTKPQYCDEGNLVNNCQICGCPEEETCFSDGSCKIFQEDSYDEDDTNITNCSDNDGDGYYTTTECAGASEIDCNDANSNIHPNANEICENNIDDNCDGSVDEGCDSDTGGGEQNDSSPEGGVCSDSDNGKNYNVKGVVNDGREFTDICIAYVTEYGYQSRPFCTPEDYKCSVREGYCGHPDHYSIEDHQCPSYCQDGACVQELTHGCKDSDEGVDYYEKGTTTLMGTSETYIDSCVDNVLTEYSCPKITDNYYSPGYTLADYVTSEEFTCPGMCEGGVCKEADHPDALYMTQASDMVSNPFTGAVNLDLVYNEDNNFVPLCYIHNTNGLFYMHYPDNTIRGAVRIRVAPRLVERNITIWSDVGIKEAYLPAVGQVQFTMVHFYIAKDGSSYWGLRNHGESGNADTEVMGLDEAFQPQHLARQAP
jgi:hypothetical protein